MKLPFQFMLVPILLITAANAAPAPAQPKHGCHSHCGAVGIPYPFGTSPDCYLNEDFLITCNDTYNPPKPFLGQSNIHVINISIDGELHVLNPVAEDCKGDGITSMDENSESWFILSKFTISNTQNKFTVIGCNSYAYIRGYKDGHSFRTGCISLCDDVFYVEEGSCTGTGCCQIDIPKGLQNINFTAYSFDDNKQVSHISKCTYAFVVAKSQFNFSSDYLFNLRDQFPMVLDWTITGDGNCTEASNKSNYACQRNAECYAPDENSSGYLCRCKEGYRGNPYLSHGCRDINECEDSNLNNCTHGHECENEPGSYTCRCREGYYGDGRRDGEGCIPNRPSQFPVIKVILGVGIFFLVLLVSSSWLYFTWKKRKLIKLQEKFFQQNGGFLLQEQLAKRNGSSDNAKVFTAEELKKATNNYAHDRIIGRGGYGTVYKGFLTDKDNYAVAIKKSRVVDKSRIEQFINEVVVLSQINHRNVVRLLGCCLETEVPLLVYEFVSNGTLFEHIHNRDKASTLSWETRLRIAAETAGVLSYLHSVASTPIIHRDIKSANILLDANFNAKVSDFGASKLVSMDITQLSTIVQGTLGYLDPEYLHTSQLTEKSDVYSFGVVLVELMTGKKPILFDRPEQERNLVIYFLSLLKEGCLFEIIENHMVNDDNKEQLKAVAKVATMCLRVKREERPTMREVATELERLIIMYQHSQDNVQLKPGEEKSFLICKMSDANKCDVSSSNAVAGYDSNQPPVPVEFEDGR